MKLSNRTKDNLCALLVGMLIIIAFLVADDAASGVVCQGGVERM